MFDGPPLRQLSPRLDGKRAHLCEPPGERRRNLSKGYANMLLHNTSLMQPRLQVARRIFSLVPLVVFFLTLMALASTAPSGHSTAEFLHTVLQAVATSLASTFVSIAAYGFYRYLLERSPGL